jgi:hypothetical protein
LLDEQWLDEEIYHAVMDAIKARENLEINGNDDVDEDASVEPRPTRREFYQAASVITRYMDDMDDPIARRIEALLGSFNRQLRLDEVKNMQNSSITDFFMS